MFIGDVVNSGAIPVLELSMQFAARRQTLIAHNIANAGTPGFQTVDVDPGGFQRALGEAIDRGRAGGKSEIPAGWSTGVLAWRDTREVQVDGAGRLRLSPRTASGNVLRQDRNESDVERLMQSLAENVAAFRVSSDLLRSRYAILNVAISQRV